MYSKEEGNSKNENGKTMDSDTIRNSKGVTS